MDNGSLYSGRIETPLTQEMEATCSRNFVKTGDTLKIKIIPPIYFIQRCLCLQLEKKENDQAQFGYILMRTKKTRLQNVGTVTKFMQVLSPQQQCSSTCTQIIKNIWNLQTPSQ